MSCDKQSFEDAFGTQLSLYVKIIIAFLSLF